MFRLTPFTQSDLARSVVARETRTKVRYFDPQTARMSGWMPKPVQTWSAKGGLRTEEEALSAMTVPELRDLYAAKFGLRPTTRTKKPALVGKLLSA